MFWTLVFIVALLIFWGTSKIGDHIFDKAAAVRAEKRAKEHFKTTERFRRSIG